MYTKLVKQAIEARNGAYAPYSGFRVGAALLASDGTVYTGCNIENASYGATVCAERVAYFKAVSDGKRSFAGLAIAGGKDVVSATPPCGICRQTLSELCGEDMPVLLADSEAGAYTHTTLGALLPFAFGTKNLKEKE